jgi:putative transposase
LASKISWTKFDYRVRVNSLIAGGTKMAQIEPGSPRENGYCESLNARFRDKLLNGEILYSLREAQILIKWW